MTKNEDNNIIIYELWEVVNDGGNILPLFLIDRGDFDELYVKFKENYNSIITDKNGNIKKSHFENE